MATPAGQCCALARRLERAARRLAGGRGRVTADAFAQALPELAAQLRADAASALPGYWGRSRNSDDGAGVEIVHPKLLTALGVLAATPVREPAPVRGGYVYHAGLIHTYGYLLSWIDTPYGYKRERWLRPTIAAGLGLPARTLHALPNDGTLLQNVSFLLAAVLLRDRPRRLARLRRDAAQGAVAVALQRLDLERLQIVRIQRRARLAGDGVVSGARPRSVRLITDLVTLRRGCGAAALLCYAVDDAAAGGLRLITGFPVSAATCAELLDPANLGRQPLSPRYNAYVAGFDAPLPGSGGLPERGRA